MTPTELADYLRDTLGEKVTDTKVAYGQLTVTVEPDALPDVARVCKEDSALWFDFFDFMAGVDERDAGFSVVTHLYSVSHRHHVTIRALAPGGREAPKLPTLTGVYRGANWHEREAYDMFGIEFTGHPGLLPRILTVENFEGFPLRKEFLLSSREAKPWPGAKEPEERKEHGDGETPAAGTTGDVPISAEDKAAAAKAKAERAKAKAAELRKQKARERATAQRSPETPPEDEPFGAADIAGTAVAKDAAAGAVQGDVAAGAPGDLPGEDQPVEDPAAEAAAAEGARPTPSGAPGIEAEGRHGGAGPEGAGGCPPTDQGAGGSPPTDQGAGGSPPTDQGAGGSPPTGQGAGGSPPTEQGGGQDEREDRL